jgi:hypothetical protein
MRRRAELTEAYSGGNGQVHQAPELALVQTNEDTVYQV